MERSLDTSWMKLSLKKGRSRLRLVSQLMQPGRRCEWDTQMIHTCLRELFLFTVKSAYMLALESERQEMWQLHGRWKASIIQWNMVHTSAAKSTYFLLGDSQGLATQYNTKRHTLTNDATCRICGLRQHWVLPEEERFHFTGPDWLLLLLGSVDAEAKAKTLLLLWHAWHLRNDIMFGKGTTSIVGSVKFLISYGESLKIASHTPQLASHRW
jgi:hypothetical protein